MFILGLVVFVIIIIIIFFIFFIRKRRFKRDIEYGLAQQNSTFFKPAENPYLLTEVNSNNDIYPTKYDLGAAKPITPYYN